MQILIFTVGCARIIMNQLCRFIVAERYLRRTYSKEALLGLSLQLHQCEQLINTEMITGCSVMQWRPQLDNVFMQISS